MKNFIYALSLVALVFTSCSEGKTDLDKITFNEKVSTLLHGVDALKGEARYTQLTTLQTNNVENYTFDNLKFTHGNADTSSSIVSNVRFHITADSTVRVVVLEVYKTAEGLALADYLRKKMGKATKTTNSTIDDPNGIKLGYMGESWEAEKEGKTYILIGFYTATKPKVQGYEMMLYIMNNKDNEIKNQILRGTQF